GVRAGHQRWGPCRASSARYSRSSRAFTGSRGGPGMRRHAVSTGRPEHMLGVIILLQTLTLAIAGPATSTEYLPLRVADAEGLFAREGLSVVVKTTRAEPGAAEALVQGQADLVATSLDAMLRFGPRSSSQS